MRRFSIFVSLLVCLTVLGCKTVSDSLKYYEACKGDAVCMQAMDDNKAIASNVVSHAVDANTKGDSLGWLIGSLVGNVAAFFTGVWKGKKLVKGG